MMPPAGTVAALGLQNVLEMAQRHLQMDLTFLAEFRDGRKVFRGFGGDPSSFGWAVDDGLPLEDSYCQLMVRGELPAAVPDTAAEPAVRGLATTVDAGIGSYVGVPVLLPDGTLYGSLCTVSHRARDLDARDSQFLGMLAELVGAEAQKLLEHERTLNAIQQLLDDEDLEIAFQPIVDLDTGRLRGLEALSRFPAGHGRPDEVFARAHEVGVGFALERLAVQRALQVVPLLAPGQYVSVNANPEVAIRLAALCHDRDLPMDRIVLEITEHDAVTNYATLRDSLASCRGRGLRLAIDDAGAGYASLHHIVELRPDIIKIDRSLVHGLHEDPARRSVVRAFATLAEDLGAQLVAEGVEDAPDLSAASALGARAAQGYYLGKPQTSVEQVRTWTEQLWCTLALAADPVTQPSPPGRKQTAAGSRPAVTHPQEMPA